MKKILLILSILLVSGSSGFIPFPTNTIRAALLDAPDVPGKWRDWESQDLQDIAKTIPNAKERQEYVAALGKLYEIFSRSKPLNPPVGFEITRYRTVSKGTPIPATFRMMFFGYYRAGAGKPLQVDRETAATMDVYINRIRVLEENDYPVGEDEKGYFVYAPESTTQRFGYPVYHRAPGLKPFEKIVITNIKRPLFVPVSRERYLRSLIQKEEKELQRLTSAYNTAKQNKQNLTHYEFNLKVKREQKKAYEDELAAMSQEQRNSQAWHPHYRQLYKGGPISSGLAEPGYKGARPLVTVNEEFFDRSLPRTAFQIIVVEIPSKLSSSVFVNTIPEKVLANLDWKALEGLLAPAK